MTIALTLVFPHLSSYYGRITATTVELPRLPSFYRENRWITVMTVDCRHYHRCSISLPIITEVPRYRIRLPSNCGRFTIPSRPLPRSIVTGQVLCRITAVSTTIRNIAKVFLHRTSLRQNYRRFPLPSRPLPRWSVTEQVYREITDVLYYHPDHCHGVSLRNKVSVKLPTFSITVSTIALASTVRLPRLPLIPVITDVFSCPSRSLPRFLVIEYV